MIFKPLNSSLWDTFILPYNDKYYLFYLQKRFEAWDGYGLAVSSDLIRWEDRGCILETGSGTGTGMVYRSGMRWILNYCRFGEVSGVYFAESDDLLKWRKLSDDHVLLPDSQWYDVKTVESATNARWGDMWVIPKDDGTFLGMLTATTKEGSLGANGAVGMASSMDGIQWEVEPPVSIPCGMAWAELGCYVNFGRNHYLLVGSSSMLGPRFDPVYNTTGRAGGMYVMMSEGIRGPYRMIEEDPLLLGCRNTDGIQVVNGGPYTPVYYARILRVGQQILLHHHWLPRENFIDAWLGTMKVLEEEKPGKLVLRWWTGNERLKGKEIFNLSVEKEVLTPFPQPVRTAEWKLKSGFIMGSTGSTALAYFNTTDCYTDGVVIETELVFEGTGAGGIFFGIEGHGSDKPYEGVACLLNMKGLYEFGRVTSGICGPTFIPENHVKAQISSGQKIKLRILLRGEFIEVYADDFLVQCYGFTKVAVHNVGVFVERGKIQLQGLQIYKFDL